MAEHIGSFIPIELGLTERTPRFPELIALNRATSALKLFIESRGVKTLHVPAYCCQVVFDGLKEVGVEVVRYTLNEKLLPRSEIPEMREDEYFMFINFFGILDRHLNSLGAAQNIVIDNAHAFYCEPMNEFPTFYSARKFFGVADGAYLYDPHCSNADLETDVSFDRYRYMLMYHDVGQDGAHAEYRRQEHALGETPVMKMSRITEDLLGRIPYGEYREKRVSNFEALAKSLTEINQLDIDDELSGPLYYPLLLAEDCAENVRQALKENRIFTPCLWENVTQSENPDSCEYKFATGIVPLPIDHRYGAEEMGRISSLILDVVQV